METTTTTTTTGAKCYITIVAWHAMIPRGPKKRQFSLLTRVTDGPSGPSAQVMPYPCGYGAAEQTQVPTATNVDFLLHSSISASVPLGELARLYAFARHSSEARGEEVAWHVIDQSMGLLSVSDRNEVKRLADDLLHNPDFS